MLAYTTHPPRHSCVPRRAACPTTALKRRGNHSIGSDKRPAETYRTPNARLTPGSRGVKARVLRHHTCLHLLWQWLYPRPLGRCSLRLRNGVDQAPWYLLWRRRERVCRTTGPWDRCNSRCIHSDTALLLNRLAWPHNISTCTSTTSSLLLRAYKQTCTSTESRHKIASLVALSNITTRRTRGD